jgi:hypothetical protein
MLLSIHEPLYQLLRGEPDKLFVGDRDSDFKKPHRIQDPQGLAHIHKVIRGVQCRYTFPKRRCLEQLFLPMHRKLVASSFDAGVHRLRQVVSDQRDIIIGFG